MAGVAEGVPARPRRASPGKGVLFEARELIRGLAPGQSVEVPKPEGVGVRDWQMRLAGVACVVHGRGACRTRQLRGAVWVDRVLRPRA